jgi:hypothetical protein
VPEESNQLAGRRCTRRREQSLGAESERHGAISVAVAPLKRPEGTGRGKPGTALRRGQFPEGQTLDVAVGRNKPTRHVVEQAVEGGWNAEDGT